MASIVDDRGFNQGFRWSRTQEVRMERRARAILDAAPMRSSDRLLEVGCGTGELTSFLARETTAHVTGVDLCAPFIEQATKRFAHSRLNYVAADLSRPDELERLGHGWSAVVGNGILHHLYHRIDEALPGLRRLLAPGGRFVFWEPNLFNPFVYGIFSFAPLRKLARLEPDEMAFTPAWIRGHLQAAGFTDIDVSFRDFLVPTVPYPLVPLVVKAGGVAERLPVVDHLAQSLFISATSP